MLLARRSIAAFLDALIIVIPFSLVAVTVFAGAMNWSLLGNLVVLVVMTSYFGVLGGACGGQTLGKKLLGIRVTAIDGSPLTYYQSFLRTLVLFLLADCLRLAIELPLAIFRWPDEIEAIAEWSAYIAAPLIVPISVFASRGRMGIHDLLARTTVVSISSVLLRPQIRRWPILASLIPSVLLTAILATKLSERFHLAIDEVLPKAEEVTDEILRNHHQVFEDSSRLPLLFKEGPEYFTGQTLTTAREWTDADFESINLAGTPLPLPDQFRYTRPQLDLVVVYEIPVHRKGYLSPTFQSLVSRELGRRAVLPRQAVEIVFSHTRKIFAVTIKKSRRYFVIPIDVPGGGPLKAPGRVRGTIILEEDAKEHWEWMFSFFLSDTLIAQP